MKINKLFIALILMFLLKGACYAEYDFRAVREYNNGIDYTNQENYKDAVTSFEQAITIEPDFTDAYYNLGIVQQYLGNQDKALEAFQELLKYKPDDYEVINKMAVIYHNKGDKEKALEYIKKIPQNDPNYGMVAELMKSMETAQTQLDVEAQKKQEMEKINQILKTRALTTYSGLEGPTGIAMDSKGNLYIANYSDNSIICINLKGEKTVIAQDGAINGPLGLAVDKDDNLYVANYESNQIILIPASDKTPQVLPYIVKKPYFIMIDSAGVLYVSEQGNNSVSQHKLEQ